MDNNTQNNIAIVGRIGLITKGIVYCLLGAIAFMATFNINGQSVNNASKKGVLDFLDKQTGGQILLAVLALGLVCYSIWRFIEFVRTLKDSGKEDKKDKVKSVRYLFSGISYGLLAVSVIKRVLNSASSSGNKKQDVVRTIMQEPAGQWLIGVVALGFVAVGIYQIYYGYSEKFKKHVDETVTGKSQDVVLVAGKVGYMARGVVWLLLAWLLGKAAMSANASQAGGTSEALSSISDAPYGVYLLAAIGLGLVCYGVFSFVRAKYEDLA
ncbi:DUF1206 domain-containing protein [Flavobacterium litorale]|uniref:DUF1206 domain-containing protein n=1 Tax=Flavobacterium litorale TaxID=2856519 RepID=A0ABX8V4Z9_9FLAO|nr:DUF1206 domain-containing protein [Flavobacterium litorale]QYJ67842.1 DUF1206 domain-containing protein [Flavobacterium litorale]